MIDDDVDNKLLLCTTTLYLLTAYRYTVLRTNYIILINKFQGTMTQREFDILLRDAVSRKHSLGYYIHILGIGK